MTSWHALYSQQIQISDELNLKNDFAYYLLTNENKQIILIRDKAFKLSLQLFEDDNHWSIEKNLNVLGKKWRIIEILNSGEQIDVYYTAKLDSTQALIKSSFDLNGQSLKHKFLLTGNSFDYQHGVKMAYDENENWVLFKFDNSEDENSMLMYSVQRDSVFYQTTLNAIFSEQLENPVETKISSIGECYFIFSKKSERLKKRKWESDLFKLNNKGNIVDSTTIYFENTYPLDWKCKIDEVNNQFVIAGVYGTDRNPEKPKGHFIYYRNDRQDTVSNKIVFNTFSDKLLNEWTGGNKKLARNNELLVQKIELLQDGSAILFLESHKELSRRPYFSSGPGPDNASSSRWIDYYFEDVLCINYNPFNKVEWETVLHKRQFSQDDDGIFSSFFIVETEDFVRLIFNDEIRNESTVSEYVLKSDGEIMRKSILNTSYKKLNLRFKDSIQLDADSIVVPSETNGKLVIVKILFNK